jgi:hypothetical protein
MSFIIPDDDTSSDLNQSRWFQADIQILVAGYSATGVASGCAVTAQGTPNMTVAVAAGTVLAASSSVAVTGGNLTVGAAHATLNRIDLITVSATGVKTITAGTAAASPKPPLLPAGHIGLAMIYVAALATSIVTASITDKRVLLDAAGAFTGFAAPAFTLGTTNVAGAAATAVASNSTVAVFDATVPTISAVGDTAATGSAAKTARRDHLHGREAFGASAANVGTSAAGTATTPSHSDHVHATGAGTPSTQAFGDAAATGSGPAAAMTDHKHAMPGDGGLLVNRTHSAPADGDLVAGDLRTWFDQTNGAAKVMWKGKTADGTVVTGSLNLT